MDELLDFERAMAQTDPDAVLPGASISPDGNYGVALTILPSANDLMDDVLERRAGKWGLHMGGNGGGFQWSLLGQVDRGVLHYEEEAPEGASVARILYQGQEYRMPVRHGHFLFVAWDAPAPSSGAPTEGTAQPDRFRITRQVTFPNARATRGTDT
jgi:hypothetical protein